MSDPRCNGARTDVSGTDANKHRDGKDPAESMHHDGSFGRYMQLKVTKLREQFDAQQMQNVAAKSDIFRGVSIYVNGYTRPSHAELKQLMALHGGRFENYLYRDSVSHIICSNLPDTKIKQLAHERKPIPIVRPEWVVASINAGRLLPITDFQLETLSAAQPNQRRLFDFKRHDAPQLPAEELYPALQGQGQEQRRQEGGSQEGGPQGLLQVNEDKDGRPTKRLRSSTEDRNSALATSGSRLQQQHQEKNYWKEKETEDRQQEHEFRQPQHEQRHLTPQNHLLEALDAHEPLHRHHHSTGNMGTVPGRGPGPPSSTGDKDMPSSTIACCPAGLRGVSPPPALGNLDAVPMLRNPTAGGQDINPAGPFVQGRAAQAPPAQGPAQPESGSSGVDSPQAAKALASELRASSDLARGAPRSTRTDPRFMETFFKASRLHFIGTWKTRIEALMSEVEAAAPNPVPFTRGTERVIIHVDMDCFFASAAVVGRPELSGKPLAVCHSNSSRGTGEVSSANYLARSFGVRADMFIAEAKRRCPDLVVVPYEFDRYQTISEQVYRILMSYTSVVQPVSCDEAFLDVTGLGSNPEEVVARLRADIATATQCTASAGIGPNMLVAKLATRRAKPNGQFRVTRRSVLEFLGDLKVEDLPGVGWSLTSKLEGLGITKVRQVWSTSRTLLQKELGAKVGSDLWAHAHGQDDRRVEPPKARKSVGAEVNYGIRFEGDTTGKAEAERFVGDLAGEVAARLKTAGVRGRSLVLKVKRRQAGAPEPAKFMGHGACDNISRSVTMSRFTDDAADLRREAVGLLRALNIPPEELRGLGITVAKLDNDPASHTTRPSATAAAKLQAPPRTTFDPSKPPPWVAFFQRKPQQQQQQQQPAVGQEGQQDEQAENSALRAVSSSGEPITPTKSHSSSACQLRDPAAASAGEPLVTAGPSGVRTGPAAPGGIRMQGLPRDSGAAPPAAGSGAAVPTVDVPSWYAALYHEWSPVSVWDQARKQQQQQQSNSPVKQQQRRCRPPLETGAASDAEGDGNAAGAARAAAVGLTPAGATGEQAQLQADVQLKATDVWGSGVAIGNAPLGPASQQQPYLHPMFAALLSQPAATSTAAPEAARADRAVCDDGGALRGDDVDSECGEVLLEPTLREGSAPSSEEALAARNTKAADSALKVPAESVNALANTCSNHHAYSLMCTRPAKRETQQQEEQQLHDVQQSKDAADADTMQMGGSRAVYPPLSPPSRPAASATHDRGGTAAVAGAAGLALPACRPQTNAVPAISSASTGGVPRRVESINLFLDLAKDEDVDDSDGVYMRTATDGHRAANLLEAAGETNGGAAPHRMIQMVARAARGAPSETTIAGRPVASIPKASGSAAARWPAAFLRPPAGSGPAGQSGSGAADRGRRVRGRAAAESSGRRGGTIGRNGSGGAVGGNSSSASRDQGPVTTAGPAMTAIQIDRGVLAELPPELRREVEREYGILPSVPTQRPVYAAGPLDQRPSGSAKRPRRGATAAAQLQPHGAPQESTGGCASDGGAPSDRAGHREARAHVPRTYQDDTGTRGNMGGLHGRSGAQCGVDRGCPLSVAGAAMPISMGDVDLAVLDELPLEVRNAITAALRDPSPSLVMATASAEIRAHEAGLVSSKAAPVIMRGAGGGRRKDVRPPSPVGDPSSAGVGRMAGGVQDPVADTAAARLLTPRPGEEARTSVLKLGTAQVPLPVPSECFMPSGAVATQGRIQDLDTRLPQPGDQAALPAPSSVWPDVQEVMTVAALPVGSCLQQRLAMAASHMFLVSGVDGATAATAATTASATAVRLGFLNVIRNVCIGGHDTSARYSTADPRRRCSPHGDTGVPACTAYRDGQGGFVMEGVNSSDDRLKVTFMAFAFWLISQDENLEEMVATWKQVLRSIEAMMSTGRFRFYDSVHSYVRKVVRVLKIHVLAKYGFDLSI